MDEDATLDSTPSDDSMTEAAVITQHPKPSQEKIAHKIEVLQSSLTTLLLKRDGMEVDENLNVEMKKVKSELKLCEISNIVS